MTRDELERRVAQVRVGILTPDELRAMCSEEEFAVVLEIEPRLEEFRA
mgnify:CR=1 FL=1